MKYAPFHLRCWSPPPIHAKYKIYFNVKSKTSDALAVSCAAGESRLYYRSLKQASMRCDPRFQWNERKLDSTKVAQVRFPEAG